MDYLEATLRRLSATRYMGYHAGAMSAAEPTALAALALLAHGREAQAKLQLGDLLALQTDDRSVGITPAQQQPGWATPLAVLAWRAAQQTALQDKIYGAAINGVLAWILETRGTLPETVTWHGGSIQVAGWPWVDGTHSWLEPTATSLLALKHTLQARHPRARDAVLLVVNRLLERGGCNYGNTIVFGQELRPHLQTTGLCLMALGGEADTTGRIGRSCDYLLRELSARTATASLCYGLLGLATQNAYPAQANDWLEAAADRTLARDPAGYKLALLALAALGPECPLIPRVRSFEPSVTAG